MRSLGSSVGITISSGLLVQQAAVHRTILGEIVTPYNASLDAWLAARGLDLTNESAVITVAGEIGRQAQMLAFINLFWFLGWSFAALIPLILLMREPASRRANRCALNGGQTTTMRYSFKPGLSGRP